MKKSKSKKECKFCSKLRPLSKHLYELAEYCTYLDNTVIFKNQDPNTKVRSVVIGDWLKLSSQLEKVKINTWKFADDSALYCRPIADQHDSDSEHFSRYSTVLTKFLFVCNSLEETYRFVAANYDELPEIIKLSADKRLRTPSMKASYLVDRMKEAELPTDHDHFIGTFVSRFKPYKEKYSPEMSGMDRVKQTDLSYGLHLVRNLRNHVAHGVFPLVDNPEYYMGEEGLIEYLAQLLLHACRVSGIYIQMLISKYNSGFQSQEYQSVEGADDDESEYFLRNCTVDYGLKLHMLGEFSFENPFNYNANKKIKRTARSVAALTR